MNIKMLTKILAVSLTAVAVLAGCSSTTGPNFNINEVQLTNGQKAYRAECYGVFSDSGACITAARKMCGNQKVNVLQTLEGTNRPANPSDLIFTCSTPEQPAPVTSAPEPQPAPVVAPVSAPRKVSLDEKTNFAFDSAALTPKAKGILDKLVAESQGTTFSSVTVEGFTDSTGPVAYNIGLSERRAQAVLDYLKGHGMKAGQFASQGFGKSRPVASNATSVGRAENRRVEVTLTP